MHICNNCKHPGCLLPRVENGLCGYHLSNPPEDTSHYSVYCITGEDGQAFVEATEIRIADRIKEHFHTPNSPIGRAIKPGSVWRGECLDTGLSRRQAIELVSKEKARLDLQQGKEKILSKNNGRSPPKRELVIVAAKIPKGIVVRLDRAAENSWNTRNAVISRILEQYLEGSLVRLDKKPLDFSESIGLP